MFSWIVMSKYILYNDLSKVHREPVLNLFLLILWSFAKVLERRQFIIDFDWIRKNRYKTLFDASKQLFIYVDGISKVQRVVEINMCTLLIDMIRCAHGQCTVNRPSGQSSPAESSVNSSYIVWRRSPVYKYTSTRYTIYDAFTYAPGLQSETSIQ